PARSRRSTARKSRTRGRAGRTLRSAKKTAKKKTIRAKAQRPSAKRPAPRASTAKRPTPRARQTPAPRPAASANTRLPKAARPALLDRERRQLSAEERDQARDASAERLISSARAGHDELKNRLTEHTETSPVLTAGDVDAKWQDAYAVGDEAP